MKHYIFILSFVLCSPAFAGILGNSFFVEPYLAHKTENSKLTDLASTVTEIRTSTPVIGLKLGFRSMVGIDINVYTDLTQGKADITNFSEKPSFNKKTSGVELGVNSLGIVKMYLGGSFQNDFNVDESPSALAFKISGPSYHVGLLIKLLPFLNLGLQYNLNQYNTIKGNAFTNGDRLETYYSKIDTHDYNIYLSTTF